VLEADPLAKVELLTRSKADSGCNRVASGGRAEGLAGLGRESGEGGWLGASIMTWCWKMTQAWCRPESAAMKKTWGASDFPFWHQ